MFRTICVTLVLAFVANDANAQVPFTFQPGQPARAADVNANFSAVVTALANNDSRISASDDALAALQSTLSALQDSVTELQSDLVAATNLIGNLQSELAGANAKISTLESQVAGINNTNVIALEPYLNVTTTEGPRVTFTGVNVQIVNGAMSQINGLGNLIVGYDLPRFGVDPVCSDGDFPTADACIGNGKVWAVSHKSGSHNIVGGFRNSYSSYGGLVVGQNNAINNVFATISGGRDSISGGDSSSVSGGALNVASGGAASVSGGIRNVASGDVASVSGGDSNVASGNLSSVSGGRDRIAPGLHDWAAGSLFEDQ